MATLNLRIDDELYRHLAREARLLDQTRPELARQAIVSFLSQRERRRFLDEIARAARDRDEDETRALSREALVTDNEALELAERSVARRGPGNRLRRPRGSPSSGPSGR